jgi:hypothetical protein
MLKRAAPSLISGCATGQEPFNCLDVLRWAVSFHRQTSRAFAHFVAPARSSKADAITLHEGSFPQRVLSPEKAKAPGACQQTEPA